MVILPLPHEDYAKRLIRAKVGNAETIPVKDCFDLMLQFAEEERRIANQMHKIANDALGTKYPSPFLVNKDKIDAASFEFYQHIKERKQP